MQFTLRKLFVHLIQVMQQVSDRLQNIQGEVLSPLDISNIAWSFGNVGYQDVDCIR